MGMWRLSASIFAGIAFVLSPACTSQPADSLLAGAPSSGRAAEDRDGDRDGVSDGDDAGGPRDRASRDAGGGDSSTTTDGPMGPPGTLVPGTTTRQFSIAGQQRQAIIVVPPQAASKPVPLVIALHGNGDSSSIFVQTSGLAALAVQRGFVLAAPQGIGRDLTIGAQTITVDWDAYQSTAQGNIDLPLLDAIVAELVATNSIDVKRISTYGYSQGGYLSFRYGIDRSTSLACAAVIAAANPLGSQLTAAASRKIPFSMQIGTNDFGIAQARSTRNDLQAKSFPLEYREIQGAGHSPCPVVPGCRSMIVSAKRCPDASKHQGGPSSHPFGSTEQRRAGCIGGRSR
jgi:predicted esterase